MSEALGQAIAAWDGRSKANIEAIHIAFSDMQGFRQALIELSQEHSLESGATWLLKHDLTQRHAPALDEKATHCLLNNLIEYQDWPAKLHILQCFEILSIPQDMLTPLDVFLKDCAQSKTAFLRGWSYSALALIALQHPARLTHTRSMIEDAELSERAASVRVILKRSLKALS